MPSRLKKNMIPPEEYIKQIRSAYPGHYSNKCHKLYRSLASVYSGAEGLYNGDHIITKIDGKCYDISGEVEASSKYLPLTEYGEDHLAASFQEPVLVTD